MLLIIIDVLLLLFSFFHSDRFHQIIKLRVCHFDHVNKIIIFDGRASKQRFNCWRRAFGLLILVIHNSYKNSTIPDH
jgi:hypothetical protein